MDEMLFVLYARSWVLLNAKHNENWTDEVVINAFYLLPPPPVSFIRWKEMRFSNIEQEEHEEQEEVPHVEFGPGWMKANTEEGKRIIEGNIAKLAEVAKEIQ